MRKQSLLIAGIVVILLAIGGLWFYAWATRPLEGVNSNINAIGNQLSQQVSGSGAMMQSFQIDSTRSKAGFSIFEVLNGKDKTVIGTTDQVAGTILVDTQNPANSTASEIKVSARTLKTDAAARDNTIARFVLKSEEPGNEFLVFKTTKIEGLPAVGEENKSYALTITGDMTISGMTRPMTFQATATYTSTQELHITAKGELKRGDFNLIIPSVPFVADVGETVSIDMDLMATK